MVSRRQGNKRSKLGKSKRRRVGGGMFDMLSSDPCPTIDKKVENAKKAYDDAVAEQNACKNKTPKESGESSMFNFQNPFSSPSVPSTVPSTVPSETVPEVKPDKGGKRKRSRKHLFKRSRIRKRR